MIGINLLLKPPIYKKTNSRNSLNKTDVNSSTIDIKNSSKGILALRNNVLCKVNLAFKGVKEDTFFKEATSSSPNERQLLNLMTGFDFNIAEREPKSQKTPLHFVVEKNFKKAAREIIKRFNLTNSSTGMDPDKERYGFLNARDNVGKTPLHYAKGFEKILIENGADALAIDKESKIPSEYNEDVTGAYNEIKGTAESTINLVKAALQRPTPFQEVVAQSPTKESITAKSKPVEVNVTQPTANVTPAASAEKVTESLPGQELEPGTEIPKSETSFDLFDVEPEEDGVNAGNAINNDKTNKQGGNVFPKDLDDVKGHKELKAELQKSIITPLTNPDLDKKEFKMFDGILLYGPSGNGKIFIIKALANQTKLPLVKVDAPDQLGKAMAEAEKRFKESGKHTIVFINELNSMKTLKKTDFDDSSKKGIILIATTNDKDSIDKDILRAGRFDKHLHVGPPEVDVRKDLIAQAIKDKKLGKNLTDEELTEISKIMSGFSVADVRYIAHEAVNNALIDGNDSVKVVDFKTEIAKFSKARGLAEINEDNTTSMYDTFLKRENIKYPAGLKDVAGMEELKKELEEDVIKPLKPEFADKFNQNDLNILNGMLLHGEPGNGKTYIVEALSKETKLPMYKIDKSTVGSSLKDESVKTMKKIFDQLETKYEKTGERSILFIDEIDAIMPKRDGSNGSSKNEEINTMLQLMNNASKRGILVIGATNKLNEMDDAVLRTGRLDKHIEVPAPDLKAREGIMKLVLKDKPIAKDITDKDINALAEITTGYSSSEVRYVSEHTLRKAILEEKDSLKVDNFKDTISTYSKERNIPESSENNKTSRYDTFIKRENIKYPGGLKDVAGMEQLKKELQENIINPLKPEFADKYSKNGLNLINGFLFYGEPGNGKTFIAKALANETKLPMYKVDKSTTGTPLKDEGVKMMTKIFNQLAKKYEKTSERSIVFMDEIDTMMPKRDGSNGTSKNEEINTMLQLMDNAAERGIIVIGATNKLNDLDDAAVRPGRLDKQIEIPTPDLKAREGIIKLKLNNKPIAQGITDENINTLAKITSGYSSSEVNYVTEQTIRTAIANKKDSASVDDFKTVISQYSKERNMPESNELNTTSRYDTFLKRTPITSHDPKNFEDVGGMEDIKEILREDVIIAQAPEMKQLLEENSILPPAGPIFYGPPGTGKTYILKATAGEAGIPLYEMSIGKVGSEFVSKTSQNYEEVFNQLRIKYEKTGEASLLFIDELDSIGANREQIGSGSSYKTDDVNTLLPLLQDAPKHGIIVVGATNNVNNIDKAIKSRFSRTVLLGLPDETGRKDLILNVLKKQKISQTVRNSSENIDEMVKASEGFSRRDLSKVLNKTALKTVREMLKDKTKKEATLENFMAEINSFSEHKAREEEESAKNSLSDLLSQVGAR